jgi:hypothetical protein
VWRRLGDLALFVTGVMPDSAERCAPTGLQAIRLARITGVTETPALDADPRDLLEWFGARWYQRANERTASVPAIDRAEQFHQARRVLNATTDRYLFPITGDWLGPRATPDWP